MVSLQRPRRATSDAIDDSTAVSAIANRVARAGGSQPEPVQHRRHSMPAIAPYAKPFHTAATSSASRTRGMPGRAGVERHVAELPKVDEAMKAPAAEARAREAALESKIEAVRAEAAALRTMPWWQRH